jgi:hypothetical protein
MGITNVYRFLFMNRKQVTFYVYNAKFLNVTAGGTYSRHCD